MKRLSAIILSAAVALSLCACQSQSDDTQTAETTDVTETTEMTTVSRKPGAGGTTDSAVFDNTAQIEPTVIYDANGITMTAESITYYNSHLTYDVLIENNTESNYEFYRGTLGFSGAVVNGYSMDSDYVNMVVDAGESTEVNLEFDYDELELYGIYEIADIGVGFYYQKEDTYDDINTGIYRVTTDISDSYDYDTDTYRESIKSKDVQADIGYTVEEFSDETVYQNNYITVLSHGIVMNNSYDSRYIFIEIANTSGKNLNVHIGDININGLTLSTSNYDGMNISAGCIGVFTITMEYLMNDAQMQRLGFDGVNNITYSLYAYDADSGNYSYVFEDDGIGVAFNSKSNDIDTSGVEIYNDKDIQIIFKGMADDDWSMYENAELLVYNGRSGEIRISNSDRYDATINGEESDLSYFAEYIPAGSYGIIEVSFTVSSTDIDTRADVTQITGGLEIQNEHYKTIDEFGFTVDVK